jgi:tripartite-type tricarboxylate transporter receptor subunit TctC
LFASTLLVAPASPAPAERFPDRAVLIIVPFGAGGTLTYLANVIGQKLAEKWGTRVAIEPRLGAGGNIGAQVVSKALPDGYTLLFATQTLAVNVSLMPDVAVDPSKDLTPIIHAAAGENVLLVANTLPVHSVAELVDYAKAHPGQLNYASLGTGSTSLLATLLFNQLAGIEAANIPYNGVSQATTDIIAGRVSYWITTLGGALPNIQSGQVRALAVSGDHRARNLPDIPTFAEAGYAQFKASAWFAFFAPAGTPADIVSQMNRDLNAVLAMPDVRERFATVSIDAVGGSPEDMKGYLKDEIGRWALIIKGNATQSSK